MFIEAKGKYEYREIWKGCGVLFQTRPIWRMLFWSLGCLMLLLALVSATSVGLTTTLPMFLVGAFWFLWPWMPPWFACRKLWKENSAFRGLCEFRFSEEEHSGKSVLGVAHWYWSAFTKWTETDELFVLHLPAGMGEIIPKRFFANPSDVETARRLFETKIEVRN